MVKLILGLFIIVIAFLLFFSPILAVRSAFSVERPKEARITDKDIDIRKRIFSPDSVKVILLYAFNEGALGYSAPHTAIVDSKDSLTDLSKHEIENQDLQHYAFQWVDNRTIVISPDSLLIHDNFTSRRDAIYEGIKFIYHKE